MCKMKVCVIGAGAAGLCAARHLSKRPDRFAAVVFESSNQVGGTWVYSETTGTDNLGKPIHSSMYSNLKTNLPKEVMAFPGFPFPEDLSSFIHHSKVREYLEAYCDHFQLRNLIRFDTKVECVEPAHSRWKVKVTNILSGAQDVDIFDAVIVCNGHYFTPLIPKIPGIDSFDGQVIHSHDYRRPDDFFKSKIVAVLGAAASGVDISLDIVGVAQQVYLCHNKAPIESKLPSNMAQVRGISKCVGPKIFILTDGSKIQVDVLLLCTGYEYEFPFLDKIGILNICDQKISPLYKHMIHTEHPTLAFIGIPFQICPFPLFNVQVEWFCKVLLKQVDLPSETEMALDTRHEAEQRRSEGLPERHFHKMGDRQWDYMRQIAKAADIDPVPDRVAELYRFVHQWRVKDLMSYKNCNFHYDPDRDRFILTRTAK